MTEKPSFGPWNTLSTNSSVRGLLLLLLLNLAYFFPTPDRIWIGFAIGLMINLLAIALVALGGLAERRAGKARAAVEALRPQDRNAQTMERMRVLAGGVAHNLNNLLTAVFGHLELARAALAQSSPVHDHLDEIAAAARRAAKLAQQMLTCSGKRATAVEPLDLSDLAAEMTPAIEALVSKETTLNYDFRFGLPEVAVDSLQIREVVINLLTNASEAIGDKKGLISLHTGVVEYGREELCDLGAGDGGRYVCLEVADTGCGIDEETKARIFDPFFSTKLTGRGLGLAATLGIVRRHGGTIVVESEVEKWTSVKILLPCFEPAVAGADREKIAPEGRSGVTPSSRTRHGRRRRQRIAAALSGDAFGRPLVLRAPERRAVRQPA